MPTARTDEQLALAIRAVAAACRVTRHVQANLADIKQLTKDDRSPVTVADFAAQAVIAGLLREQDSELRLVGEESSTALRTDPASPLRGAIVDAVRLVRPGVDLAWTLDAIDLGGHDASADAYWTLDPIDGTKGFIRGQQYAVSLAYIERGTVRLGVLGCANLSADFGRPFDRPDAHGLLFFAARGAGCWSVPADDPEARPAPVHTAADAAGLIRVCESVESSHSNQDESARVIALLGGAGAPARIDSQCKYAVVARGQADAYMRLPTRKSYVEKIWDHAAGQIVAEEAGAIVSDIDDRPLNFGLGTTLAANRGIVCASPAFHARIIDAIRKMGSESH